MDVTAEVLAELERLAEAATPGPWFSVAYDGHHVLRRGDQGGTKTVVMDVGVRDKMERADAAFIAAAREAVPALVARVRELEARIAHAPVSVCYDDCGSSPGAGCAAADRLRERDAARSLASDWEKACKEAQARGDEWQEQASSLVAQVAALEARLATSEANGQTALGGLLEMNSKLAALTVERDDLRTRLGDALGVIEMTWEATGVAGTVRGLTTLADVVGTNRSDLAEAHAQAAQMREALRAYVGRGREDEAAPYLEKCNGSPFSLAVRALALPAGQALAEEVRRLREENERLRADVHALRSRTECSGREVDLTDPDDACQSARFWKAEYDALRCEANAMHDELSEETRLLREVEAAVVRWRETQRRKDEPISDLVRNIDEAIDELSAYRSSKP